MLESNTFRFTSDIRVELIDYIGSDSMIVAAARVSTLGVTASTFGNEQGNTGLINYLMKHRHGTPFEHGCMTFFVHAPIFVWREWHRHRIGFSYNEESARYKPLDPVFWIPRESRKMKNSETHTSARPNIVPALKYEYDFFIADLRKTYVNCYETYLSSLAAGIAKEVARAILPVGIYSSCWVTCNPRSLMAFLSLRTGNEAATFRSYPQAEIEEAARQCEAFFAEKWPITHAAFCKNGRVSP